MKLQTEAVKTYTLTLDEDEMRVIATLLGEVITEETTVAPMWDKIEGLFPLAALPSVFSYSTKEPVGGLFLDWTP